MNKILMITIGSRGDIQPYIYMNNEFMKLTESKAGQAAADGGSKWALIETGDADAAPDASG